MSKDDSDPSSVTQLPRVVSVPDQPCQRLYEANPVLLGYDVVQYHFIPPYHEGGKAVRGLPEYAYNFLGYQFWFSSRSNRNLFIKDPWKYAPAWGGFCSWGIARETSSKWPWAITHLGPPASPWEGWLIVNETLMFNIWSSYSDRFMVESQLNIELAAQRWRDWFGSLEAGPFNTHCIGHGQLKNWCIKEQPAPWIQPLPECTLVVEVDGEEVEVTEEEYTSLLMGEKQEQQEDVVDANCAAVARTSNVTPPECEEVMTLTNITTDNGNKYELITINGGGIVGGDKATFADFENNTNEYLQRRAFGIAGAVVGGLLVVAMVAFLVIKQKRRGGRPFEELGEVEEGVKVVEEPDKNVKESVESVKTDEDQE